jgi:TP901 family phage tail tape measure protein
MAKAFDVAFNITGHMTSSLTTAFASASRKMSDLKSESNQLKRSLRDLDNQYKRGSIGVEKYKKSQQDVYEQLNKNVSAQRRLERAQKRGSAFKQSTSNALSEAKSRTQRAVAVPATAAALAVPLLAGSSLKKGMAFDTQLDSLQALTGISDPERQQMRKLALDVGMRTKYNALESVQGEEELAKAGLSTKTIKSGGLEASLNLATAGGMGLADSANLMSNALNGYKKDNMTAAQASNYLAGAANASSADLMDLKYGLAAVGPVADGAGLSLKQTAAGLALFSNNALNGSDAGTSLKTMLLNLSPQTDKAAGLMKDLGIITKDGSNQFFDAKGNAKDLADIAGVLQKQLAGLTRKERSDALKKMFGTDAVRAANIFYKEGADGVQKMYGEMSKVTALDVARKKMDNASGAVEQLSGAFETLQIIGAETALPLVKKAANGLADVFTAHTKDVQRFSKNLSNGFEHILEPFITIKPKFDKRGLNNPDYRSDYAAQLANYNQYQDMDFSEKVDVSLDRAADAMDKWVSGSGGKAVEKIFTKLAGIAVKAWSKTLTSALKGSVESAMQGNLASAIGLAFVGNMMTGGMLGKFGGGLAKRGGGWALGKTKGAASKAWGKFRGEKGSAKAAATPKTTRTKSVPTRKPKASEVPKTVPSRSRHKLKPKRASAATPKPRATAKEKISVPLKSNGSTSFKGRALKIAGSGAKLAGKANTALAVASSAYEVATAKDKVKATGKAAGGLGGAWAGGAAGAAAGSVVPVVGTIIGGLVGSALGYYGGRYLGGKAVDAVRGGGAQKQSAGNNRANQFASKAREKATEVKAPKVPKIKVPKVPANLFDGVKASAKKLQSSLGRAASGVQSLSGMGSVGGGVSQAASALYSVLAQSPTWVNTLHTKIRAADNAMTNLINRANNANLNPGSPKKAKKAGSAASKKGKGKDIFSLALHAKGGIFNQPHLGMVAEAGYPESIVPIRPGDPNALSIYHRTGQLLGADQPKRKVKELAERSSQLSKTISHSSKHSFTYAPVIHGVNRETQKALANERENFFKQAKQYEADRKRKSFK